MNRALNVYGSEGSAWLSGRLADINRLARQRRALGIYSPGSEKRMYRAALEAAGEKAHQRAMLRSQEEHQRAMEQMERERLEIAKQQERRAGGYGPTIAAQQAEKDDSAGPLEVVGAVASLLGAIAGFGGWFAGSGGEGKTK